MSVPSRLALALVRRHARVRRVLPPGHHAYRTAGGWTYLDLRESPMMLARVLRLYEAPKVAALRAVLRPGDVFVDVGANKGDFSLLAARLMHDRGRVLCVEPEPANVEWITRSIARNRYKSIEVLPFALADADGSATLHLGEKSGWHSLVSTEGVAVTGTVEVPTKRLDDELAKRGIARVDAIKIDVEGAEEQVLTGAAQALGGTHPMTVLLDLHPGRGVNPVAAGARLIAHGFELRDPENMERPLPGAVTATTRSVLAVR
ncbi:MAG TPA: FkbM family methyltransferase [Acidimicrobiales bacterium]|nr:FkbM family methyltransferase [Acidimicrobiales bacterium]